MFSVKFVFVIGVLSVSLRNVRAVSSEDKQKMEAAMMPYIADCNKEVGVTEDDIKKAKESGTVASLDNCFKACVYKKNDLIDDHGLFIADKAEEFAKILLSNEADQKKAIEIVSNCKSVNEAIVNDGEKGCERAGLLYKCFGPIRAMAVSSEDKQKMEATIMPYIADCNKELVTEDDINKAQESGTLDALKTCFMGCILKKVKLINDQGLFDADKAEELSKKYLSDEADQKKALEVIITCKSVNERDVTDGEKGCERAGLLLKCVTPFKDYFID